MNRVERWVVQVICQVQTPRELTLVAESGPLRSTLSTQPPTRVRTSQIHAVNSASYPSQDLSGPSCPLYEIRLIPRMSGRRQDAAHQSSSCRGSLHKAVSFDELLLYQLLSARYAQYTPPSADADVTQLSSWVASASAVWIVFAHRHQSKIYRGSAPKPPLGRDSPFPVTSPLT